MVTSRIVQVKQEGLALGALEETKKVCQPSPRALERRNKTGVQRIVALNGGNALGAASRAGGGIEAEEREHFPPTAATVLHVRGPTTIDHRRYS